MGEYFGTINDVKVFEKNKLYCFHSDFSYDVYDIKGEDDMKNYSDIYELKKQVNEFMNCAYQRGYDNGKLDAEKDDEKKTDALTDKAYYDGYNSGAFEAWSCAREISLLDSNFASVEEVKNILKVFGTDNIYNILHDYTPQDAIKRLKDYEKKQNDEIKVGDEVYNLDPENVRVVTAIYDDNKGYKQAVQICKNGKYVVDKVDTLKKTGKHYDEIESILDQTRATNERKD